MGTYDDRSLICQITGAADGDRWCVLGKDRLVVSFVRAIVQKARQDAKRTTAPSAQTESFRIDHELNVKTTSPQGKVRATYDLMRCTSDTFILTPTRTCMTQMPTARNRSHGDCFACTDTFGEPKAKEVYTVSRTLTPLPENRHSDATADRCCWCEHRRPQAGQRSSGACLRRSKNRGRLWRFAKSTWR
jgi:hypothetical protein